MKCFVYFSTKCKIAAKACTKYKALKTNPNICLFDMLSHKQQRGRRKKVSFVGFIASEPFIRAPLMHRVTTALGGSINWLVSASVGKCPTWSSGLLPRQHLQQVFQLRRTATTGKCLNELKVQAELCCRIVFPCQWLAAHEGMIHLWWMYFLIVYLV